VPPIPADPRALPRRRLLGAGATSLLLSACGGGGGADPTPPPPPPPGLFRHEVDGVALVKARSQAGAVLMLEEKLCSIFEQAPVRRLARRVGDTLQRWEAPAGWHLLDFADHPSGELSLVLTTASQVRLLRLDAGLATLSDQLLLDPLLPQDPYLDEGGIFRPALQQPHLMRDAARVAALGDDLILAIRAGLQQVVAYRFARGAQQPRWRRLVEPGCSVGGRFLAGGCHDVYGQLENHLRLQLAVRGDGQIAVAVPGTSAIELFAAHRWHFNESLAADNGVLLTRLDADGHRLGTTVVATAGRTELHGLSATPTGWALVGRVRARGTEDGWDGYAALVDPQGGGGNVRLLNLEPGGDALFDIAALSDGGYLALGSCGYAQNPGGASISESAEPLLLRLDANASVVQRVAAAGGPRHNALRSLAWHGSGWLIGGLRNGPGTHSGDADLSLVRADGFLLERRDLPSAAGATR